jgi:DNA-binding beta-propeller fold protein YncE
MRNNLGRRTFFAVLIALFASSTLSSETAPEYKQLARVALGNQAAVEQEEYFDYITVDPVARRVFLSHGTEVLVVDADTFALIGRISGLKLAHGTLILRDIGRGYISDGGGNRVIIFDLATLKREGEVKTGENPDCIMYDSVSKYIFTFNGTTKDSTVINPATDKIITTIPMGGRAEFAVADGKGMVYDNIENTNEVVVLNSHTLNIQARWPIGPGVTPTALSMDLKHRRLFIGGRNKTLSLMDADHGAVIQTLPITGGVDAIIFDPNSGLVYVSTREAIHIFHEDSSNKLSEVQTIKTEYGAKTMGFDPSTRRLYLDTADFNLTASIQPGEEPERKPVPGTVRLLVFAR